MSPWPQWKDSGLLDSEDICRFSFASVGYGISYSLSHSLFKTFLNWLRVFQSSHVWMWVLDHKGGWVPETLTLSNWGAREDSRIPWTAQKSNQSVLKEISPKYSLEGLMLELKLQYFGQLMWKRQLIGKDPMLGKMEGKGKEQWGRGRDG